MEEQDQCPKCEKYNVKESNFPRGFYVGGVCGVLAIPLHWNMVIGLVCIGVMLLGLVSMMATGQWRGIKRAGIFFEILALILIIPFQFNFVTVGILALGILLYLIGRPLQKKTSERNYKCADCGYEFKHNELNNKEKSESVPV